MHESALVLRSDTHLDHSAWGTGPWDDEPDYVQWRDVDTGLACLAHRPPYLSVWCGYVGVDETHPLFGLAPGELPALPAHGGVNYTCECDDTCPDMQGVCHAPEPGEPERIWWLGFDCGHGGCDESPVLRVGLPYLSLGGTYRTLHYVSCVCHELACALADYSKEHP